ncbi:MULTISPECIES: methyltransferase type 11 [Sphingobacterium]|uniref:methyltransferase type 11 n=1 Tax=Sphingobacterium TaxID=28453 RepID=UPI00257A352F|nr:MULTISPECIES: methyltransferase type 11 [Sphingobacterium]
MKRVEIFKTNVCKYREAQQIVTTLLGLFSAYKINFDLDDDENILRIESSQSDIDASRVMKQMFDWGYECERIV